MTDTPRDYRSHSRTTFQRHDHGTQVREAYWPFTGMRSLSASLPDGNHRISFITHDDSERRHTSLNVHQAVKIEVGTDDALALDIRVMSEDGTAISINLFGITLSDLLEAVAEAVATKTPITEDSHP